MDRAHSSHSRLSPSSVSSYDTAILQRRSPTHDLPQETPTRQRRLLENRNARFAAKRISLSDLSSRFTQLIYASDYAHDESAALVNQENMSPNEQYTNGSKRVMRSRRSLGVLEETTNTGRTNSLRKRGSIPIHLDDPERPLLERSPVSSPGYQYMASSETTSPVDLNLVQDGFETSFSRNALRADVRRPSRIMSPSAVPARVLRTRRSAQFDPSSGTQEYIEHIEQQLQLAKQENYSPTTNKSLKDQLQKLRAENKQLQHDMAIMRDTMEAELKSSVEHRMSVEAELRFRVRDLQEDLDRRDLIIQELKYQHEDKRLENNAVESLKSTIDRLQLDLQAMEDENRSMSRRNEKLSELLAMSPTKAQASFELRSPVRERRSGRPISMIIPRLPSSPPLKPSSHPTSSIVSPSISTSGYFNLPHLDEQILEKLAVSSTKSGMDSQALSPQLANSIAETDEDNMSKVSDTRSHQSSSPVAMSLPFPPSPLGTAVVKVPSKRKPRKFMSGSTQLKPLLLPALTSENVALISPSGQRSPRSGEVRDFSQESFDPTSFFLSQPLDAQSIDEVEPDLGGGPGPETVSCSDNSPTIPQITEAVDARHSLLPAAIDLNSFSSVKLNADSDLFYEPNCRRAISWDEVCRVIEQQASEHENLIATDQDMDETIYCRRPSETPARGIDITALNKLRLPEAKYDPYPTSDAVDGNELNLDIPQPLFSPVAKARKSRLRAQPVPDSGLVQPETAVHLPDIHQIYDLQDDAAQVPASSQATEPLKQAHLTTRTETAASVDLKKTAPASRASRISRSSSSNASSLLRSRSPLELLQARQFGAKPLAVLTIRTIYGTISRCTSYMRDLKRDPLALARRLLANAWFAGWSRFGRFAWWVLGIFIPFANVRKRLSWNLDSYDGEAIAQQICGGGDKETDTTQVNTKFASCATHLDTAEIGCQDRLQSSSDCTEDKTGKPGWGKSVLLWGKFSLAIALAVGGAIIKGPGEMMKEMDGTAEANDHQDPDETCRGRSHITTCRSRQAPIGARGQVTRKHHPQPSGHRQAFEATAQTRVSTMTSPLVAKSRHDTKYCEVQTGTTGKSVDNTTIRPVKDSRMHVRDIFNADYMEHSETPLRLSSCNTIYPHDSVSVNGD